MIAAMKFVMPGLEPGIHVFLFMAKTWMAGTSPAMTKNTDMGFNRRADAVGFKMRAGGRGKILAKMRYSGAPS